MMITLKKGSRGSEVRILQLALNIKADGIFGSDTQSALTAFQKAHNLTANGICDSTTWAALASKFATIRLGDKNNSVLAWQYFLNISADGIFGSGTRASTIAFQSSANLVADGIVGQKTWKQALSGAVTAAPVIQPDKKTQPTNFKQYDSRWGSVVFTRNNTYNLKQTISTSGCGPTSMADIVATWWDKSATPKELAKLVVDNGYRTYDSGTAWAFFKFAAEYYKASKFIQTSSYSTALAAIKDGAYVICSMGPGLYTTGGHFICWWNNDGTYNYVNDPASARADKAKSKQNTIKEQAKQFFIFYK